MHSAPWVRFLILIALLFSFAAPGPALARPSGALITDCTTDAQFNSAIQSGSSPIAFSCGPAVITLSVIEHISTDTVIDGGGQITLRAPNSYHFQVSNGRSLTLQNLVLADGASNVTGAIENFGTAQLINTGLVDNRSSVNGGAVVNYGSLSVRNSWLTGNQAANHGGGIYNDGGQVTILQSRLEGNKTTAGSSSGGAIANNFGAITVTLSTLSGNHSVDGGALLIGPNTTGNVLSSNLVGNSAGYGGAVENQGILNVTGSTLSYNTAVNDGGAVWNLNAGGVTRASIGYSSVSYNQAGATGGGLSAYGGTSLSIDSSTIDHNQSGSTGGGIYSDDSLVVFNSTLSSNKNTASSGGGGLYHGLGIATLTYVTVANNTAMFGAGVYQDGGVSGSLYLADTLLAYNTFGNCDGAVSSHGSNLTSDNNCGDFIYLGDQKNVDPLLGPLAYAGGPTRTRLPGAGSLAIDGVKPGLVQGYNNLCINIDQRRAARPQGVGCDIGAVETGVRLPVVFVPLLAH